MYDLKNWGVSLEDIPPEGIKVEFENISDLGKELNIKEPFSGYFKLKKLGIEVKLEGFLKGVVILECDRCLTSYEFPIEHTFKLNILPLASLNIEEEKELSEEEMEVSFYENSWISFFELLKEEIFLSLPYKRLCQPDCKGLCPICGTNLNKNICKCKSYKKDSPFAILKELFSDKKI
ncbi:MAG: 23S rRNA accumulation protein YceD [Thermodesulfobacterium sp.]|uniref:23S rRNA accumulation protein YceD n=1 Tax=Candidatus Thermodesulfobacterium syntrophicum TaxID=3060442 RepID=A0AAE3P451_9BACT|nr:23S rRNA accumulation protein YceD [Candidatus Thermodesulfobacterium syntrophicum]